MIVNSNYKASITIERQPDYHSAFVREGDCVAQFFRDGVCVIDETDTKSFDHILKRFRKSLDQSNDGGGCKEFSIVPKVDPKADVCTRNAQPLHMDALYRSDAPDLVVLRCIAPSAHGGENTVLGRHEYQQTLRLLSDEEIAELQRPIGYQRGSDVFFRHNDIADGGHFLFRYSPYPGRLLFTSELQYQAWARLSQLLSIAPAKTLKLLTGDRLLLDNRVALHGRKAFQGERHLVRSWYAQTS